MSAVEPLERTVPSDKVAISPDEMGCALNIAGVYQDTVTREWAMQTCLRSAQLAGEERIQNTWYDVNSLSDPANLLDAVRAALVADVIVVSVYAANQLPVELYVWVDAWLPRRLSRVGALAVLVGVAEPLESQSVRTLEYLQAVAQKAQLDFFPQERKRPIASSASSIELITERVGTNAQSLKELYGRRYDAYYHWGLNE
jgi:nucleotide-binding universal stress UspA family protein